MTTSNRILIVDDDPDVHSLLEAALAGPDRELESAFNGLDALQRIESSSYQVVITDVNMPGLDGMALLERIHLVSPQTKVMVMTVASTAENIMRAITERAFAYFSKPFLLDTVADLVHRALTTATLDDDIEVLSAVPHWLELRLRCKLETADRFLHFLRELAMDLPRDEKENIAMAFREILLNAIEHGGGSDPEKHVVISYVRTVRSIVYYVRDPGKGFSFQTLPHAAVSYPDESPFDHVEVREKLGIRPGGFGILMTRQLVDELIYNERGNEVVLIKYLS